MARLTGATALLTAAGVLGFWHLALAADPQQSDFDTCNREAQSMASTSGSTPSASPGGTMSRQPDASGGMTAGGSASGSVTAPAPSGSATGSTSGSPSGTASGSTSSDDTKVLSGMSAKGQTDSAFKQAYLGCMKRRGF